MARYKGYDYSQGKFLSLQFEKQIIPGTFEHTLHYLIDNELDLSIFDLRKLGSPLMGDPIAVAPLWLRYVGRIAAAGDVCS